VKGENRALESLCSLSNYFSKYLFKYLTKAASSPHPEFGLLIQAAAAAAG